MNNLGELYRHQGQFDKAIDLFKKVLNINSNNPITNNTTANPNNDLKANSII